MFMLVRKLRNDGVLADQEVFIHKPLSSRGVVEFGSGTQHPLLKFRSILGGTAPLNKPVYGWLGEFLSLLGQCELTFFYVIGFPRMSSVYQPFRVGG